MYYIKLAVVALIAMALWSTTVLSGALFGWWRRPVAPQGDRQAFLQAAIELIERGDKNNTALVLIKDGSIYAEYYSSRLDPVDRNTVFATASMSKWITAFGVMKLVEEGKLDLDSPIDDYLSRWHLPRSEFDHRKVTARRLLSHTAGLTDGLGFGDFLPEETIPPLEQSLTAPRTSSGRPVAIEVGMEPGSKWKYSGGSYLVLELLIEEISGEGFEAYIDRTIFKPLGMTRSGYQALVNVTNSAKSYDQEGRPATIYRYASKAATGFHTSASDLTTFVIAQLTKGSDKPLSREMMYEMRQPHGYSMGIGIWGLGTMLYAPTSSGNFIFGHDGANEPAIGATVRINPDTNDGIIVLTTGNRTLASTLGAHWVLWQTGVPDFLSIPAEVARVVPALVVGVIAIPVISILLVMYKRAGKRANHTLAYENQIDGDGRAG